MYTDQDQIFDDEVYQKCSVKNMLRFHNSNIARRRIGKRLDYRRGILLHWIIENSDHFKNEKK